MAFQVDYMKEMVKKTLDGHPQYNIERVEDCLVQQIRLEQSRVDEEMERHNRFMGRHKEYIRAVTDLMDDLSMAKRGMYRNTERNQISFSLDKHAIDNYMHDGTL